MLAALVILGAGISPAGIWALTRRMIAMQYSELRAALEEFNFSERVSLRQIKERYRDLVRCYHPDSGAESDPEKIQRINEAYRILRSYCHEYLFNCSHSEFLEQNPEERLREQFAQDSLWGSRAEDV